MGANEHLISKEDIKFLTVQDVEADAKTDAGGKLFSRSRTINCVQGLVS